MYPISLTVILLVATVKTPGLPDQGYSLPYTSLEECQAGGRMLEEMIEGNYYGDKRPVVTWSCKRSQ